MKYKKAGMVLTAAILALGMGGSFTGCGEKPVDYKPIDMLEESPAQIPDGFLTILSNTSISGKPLRLRK